MSEKIHVIKDENLGGVLREFVEVDRKEPGSVEFEGYYGECRDDKIVDWFVGAYKTLEPTDIVHIYDPSGQPKRYRMVVRKAKVGDRIIIIDADVAYYIADNAYYLSNYKNGDVLTVFDVDCDGRVTEVKPIVFDDKINVILPYEYCVLEPVHDEETSPTIHEMLANLSEQIVKLNQRIDRLADANEQAIATVARDVERVDADLIKLRKKFEESKDVKLTLSSGLVAKLIEKGLND